MTILSDILSLFDTQFKKSVAETLIKNEVGSSDDTISLYAFSLSFAGDNSGYSFGFNQMDLGQGNIEYNDLFKSILDNYYGASFYLSIQDRVHVAGNANALTAEEDITHIKPVNQNIGGNVILSTGQFTKADGSKGILANLNYYK